MSAAPPHVGFFVTCLVDLMRPSIGFAAIDLLEKAGCTVDVPAAQTCCGQPAFNSGDKENARRVARLTVDTLDGFDYVVVPSGSCAGMIKMHYLELFADDPVMMFRVRALADKTYELTSFLVDVLKVDLPEARYEGIVTYHDSCSGLRELGVKQQPRALLAKVGGLSIKEGKEAETCCGFGGLFCVKYPDISERMVDAKVDDILATGADTLIAGDLGCLMNMAGRLKRRGAAVKVRHVAEVLAGAASGPAVGEGEG